MHVASIDVCPHELFHISTFSWNIAQVNQIEPKLGWNGSWLRRFRLVQIKLICVEMLVVHNWVFRKLFSESFFFLKFLDCSLCWTLDYYVINHKIDLINIQYKTRLNINKPKALL
jgi:hypothetical protein